MMLKLLANNRFYILSFSVLLSVLIFAWLRIVIADDQLLIMRTQQLYGLVAMIYLYVALLISPLGSIVGSGRTKGLIFARRAIGVSAFHFAMLHAVIAFYGQMGGFSQVSHLPTLFVWSLLGGAVAVAIMLFMTVTSTDWFIKTMTYRWWKLSHRLIYLGGVLILLHVWTLGTHLVEPSLRVALVVSMAIFFGFETVRLVKYLNKKYKIFSQSEAAVVGIAIWAIATTLVVITPSIVPNYHSRHTDDSQRIETTDIHKMMGH